MNAKRTLLLVGLFIGMFFSSLDQTVVGTAMPRIIGDLNGLAIFTWVTITYLLTFTAAGPIAGKLADLFGRRMVYTAGIALFIVGSALCGMSRTMTELILFRGLQGIGGGMMVPMIITIVGDLFPPEQLVTRLRYRPLFAAGFVLMAAGALLLSTMPITAGGMV